ncbi:MULTISPECIES: hypothetical protein [Micrococcales]|uniref:Uncharacterized protein n=1 Tax=Brachybacterium alimentarium TaxID=47845 RepID=A0A2A3YNG3_9MICO|nr:MULTISPECIES: hypothetical protein [Micrococcales]PCC32969.1 hypothetical protein CIK71_09170 [Brachybacterium alimentarium]PCC40840.1 hypothetical protein CIK66_00920 [Brachybacterium alimentarium]RCS63821.1 hypothetical protein CIK81_11500 [Brachybacterium sp. JB7]RCS67652.1 hypothetical protein CIK73_10540 [Brachybacterium alimentarium]RCS76874.1 hypothetical protein CIK70_14975 [Brachybacterium alimentarium]
MSDLDLYFAHQKTVQTIHGFTIRYRLALIGPTVTVVHSEIDESLPERSVRIATGDAGLVVESASWIDRRDELDAHVLVWLLEHIDLRASRPRPAARRYDEVWMNAWREANPGRR